MTKFIAHDQGAPWKWTMGLVLLCWFPAWAQAQEQATPQQRALAEALYRDAKVLMSEGKPLQACPKLKESQQLDPGGGTQLLLGICWERAGRTASAWLELNEALAIALHDAHDARVAVAREHLQALEPRLMKVRLEFEGEPPASVAIHLDGTAIPAAAWDTPQPLDPGRHQLSISAPGKRPLVLQFVLDQEGATKIVRIPALEDVEEPAPSATTAPDAPDSDDDAGLGHDESPDPESAGSGRVIWGGIAAGTGVAAVVTGSVFGLRAISLNNEVEEACPDPTCGDPTLQTTHDQAKTSAAVSTVAFAVGAAALGVGAYLLLSNGPRRHAGPRSVEVAAQPRPGGGKMLVRVVF